MDILSSSGRPQLETLILKYRLLPRKNLISGVSLMFFNYLTILLNIVVTYKSSWHPPNQPSFFLKKWKGNLVCDFPVEIWRIDLMIACHVLPILFSFVSFSGDSKYYQLLVDIKWCKCTLFCILCWGYILFFIPNFGTIIFVLFFWICLLCSDALTYKLAHDVWLTSKHVKIVQNSLTKSIY